MSETPERIWAWSFNTWDEWGGYARPNNRHPIGDKERKTGAEYIRADIACALPAGQPKVKPLVWYGKPADFYMFADTAFGLYEIGVEHGDEWFSDFTDHKSGKPVRLSSWQDGSIAPQAAAQADYEARILSALEPAVQPDAALAMRIAVEMEAHAALGTTTKEKADAILALLLFTPAEGQQP